MTEAKIVSVTIVPSSGLSVPCASVIRGLKSGRLMGVGDVVTEEDGDLLVTP